MTAFVRRIAELLGVPEDRVERLAGGDLAQVLLVRTPEGRTIVAKASPEAATEAAMLRSLLAAGIPAPMVEAEHEGLLLLEYVENDGVFSPAAWRDIGMHLAQLHARVGAEYGWPVDFRLASIELDNRPSRDWPGFWGERRLLATAAVLDRPWRSRVEVLAARLPDLLPAEPPPAHLHGDLWTGNLLVRDGVLAAMIDPACYHGDAEVDLAMLTLFVEAPPEFWEAYGPLRSGYDDRWPIYQLFPALVHLRVFGATYAGMVDRLLTRLGA